VLLLIFILQPTYPNKALVFNNIKILKFFYYLIGPKLLWYEKNQSPIYYGYVVSL
jgi:hypothetical protein